MNTQQIGKKGERLALNYLLANNYTLLSANWTCLHGELDLVMRSHDSTLIFVEVKTMKANSHIVHYENLTQRKLTHLYRSINAYLAKEQVQGGRWQLDVITVELLQSKAKITHYRNFSLG